MDSIPQFTVAIPMYRTKYIGWLPLESLCRQKNIDFSWELIVCEEKNPLIFGLKKVSNFKERLKDNGCTCIKYISIPKWVPLSIKWSLMAKEMNKKSKMYLIQSGDAFAQPCRLRDTYDIMNRDHPEWIESYIHVLYNLEDGCTIVRDMRDKQSADRTLYDLRGDNMAVKAEIIRELPMVSQIRYVDSWIFKSCEEIKGCKLTIAYDTSDHWKMGMHTFGMNNISMNRFTKQKKIDDHRYNIREHIPEDIFRKLKKIIPKIEKFERKANKVHDKLKEEKILRKSSNKKINNEYNNIKYDMRIL